MSHQAFIVTGLGYGDEGKGSIVDWLTVEHRVNTVIRTGGPQALHRVVTSAGHEHVFSQFGSGTLRGAATHLSCNMICAPSALLREGLLLANLCGRDVFSEVTIHADCLLVTPIQAVTGRVRELLRGDGRRGSVGVGVGETVRDSTKRGERALRARDLSSPHLGEKLRDLWQDKWSEYESSTDRASGLREPMGAKVRAQMALISNGDLLHQTIKEFVELAQRIRIVDDDYVTEKILSPSGTVVFEGSQGVLLDRVYGFYPYTTKVRSTPETSSEILTASGYRGEVHSLGILRSYATRHGFGPFVTEDAILTKALPDARNHNDDWQGNFRIGHFDAVATLYATKVCGPQAFDALVITCLDRTNKLDNWSACTAYYNSSTETILNANTLLQYKNNPAGHLSTLLDACQPVLQSGSGKPVETIAELIGIPVYAVSTGVTEKDKRLFTS